MKKLTYEFIKSEFEKEGYTLVSKEYINSKTKLDYRCPKEHEHSMILNVWQRGHRCPTCAINRVKSAYAYIKESFDKDNYILLSKEYKNNTIKLDYKCPLGHEHSIEWSGWKRGYRCPSCAGVTKPTIDFVKKSFEKDGYELLSKEYFNSYTKLNYKCSKGHKHSIKWNSWKTGYRCPRCSINARLSIDKVRASFEKYGYQLLSKTYNNSQTKLECSCPLGHKYYIVWGSWQQGHRCSTCANISNSGPGNPRWLGGISFEPYCPIWKDKEYKKYIRDRDGNKCLNPDCWKKDDNLHIHHIDYNKKNCSPYNLITVCRSCNARANTDREWHIAWYNALIYKRYLENKHAN